MLDDANVLGTVAVMVAFVPKEVVVILVWGVVTGATTYTVLGALVVANGVYLFPATTPRKAGVDVYPSLVSIRATCCVVLSIIPDAHDQLTVATVVEFNCKR